jgi:hypothetical protein
MADLQTANESQSYFPVLNFAASSFECFSASAECS